MLPEAKSSLMHENPHLAAPATGTTWRLAERLLRGLILFLCALFLLLFLYTAVKRLHFPFEIDWIESGVLTSTLRLVHGQGLYVAPSLHFVPYLYAPIYLYLSAVVTRFTGLGANDYSALRLVSVLSTLGGVALIWAFVYTETRNRLAAIAGAALYLSSYSLLGTFFDIGRVDALFVFFIVLALLLQRRGHPVLAALVWVLAFQTKQSVVPLALLILLAEWPRPRRLLASLGVFAVAAGASVLAFHYATHGWYTFYVFRVARGLGIVWRQAAMYPSLNVLHPLAIAWVVIGAAALFTGVRWKGSAAQFYLFTSFALYGGVWFVEAHRGASINAPMPVFAWTAMLFGVGTARLLRVANEASQSPGAIGVLLPPVHGARLRVFLLALAAAQLFALLYYPGWFIPPPIAYTRGDAMLRQITALPGDVYVLNHSHDAVLAGKASFAEGEALGAILDAHLGTVSANLRQQLDDAMATHRFTAMVIDDPRPLQTSWQMEHWYPLAISAATVGEHTLTSEPQWFLLPCQASATLLNDLRSELSVVYNRACEPGAAAMPSTRK